MMKRSRSNVYGRVSESSSTIMTAVGARASTPTTSSKTNAAPDDAAGFCEIRPCGMLVQIKRTDPADNLGKILRLRISHGALRFEISVNSQSTFGELKKKLVGETGLQPGEQRLLFKGKEREDRVFLDICGVKERSKVEVLEDPLCRERRLVESRKNAKIQTAQRSIADISTEVGRLSNQIPAIKKSISSGNKVPEVQITTLIELLMRQAIKLDGVTAIGTELSAAKNLQGKQVQKSVETLDHLKVENAQVKPVVISTEWETFEFDTPPPPTAARWELFD